MLTCMTWASLSLLPQGIPEPRYAITKVLSRVFYMPIPKHKRRSGHGKQKNIKIMKKLFLIAAIVLTAISVESYAQKVKLNNGKSISIRLTNDINSKTNKKTRQEPMAIVDRDVTDASGDIVLIRRGTPVQMSSTVVKAKGMGKPGSIKIDCISTTAVDGTPISLFGGMNLQGDDKRGAALGCGLGLGLTVLFPVGFFFFCMHGENVEIPANTMIQNVVVNDNYMINAE